MHVKRRLSAVVIGLTTTGLMWQGAGVVHAADLQASSTSEVVGDIADALAEVGAVPAVADPNAREVETELPATAAEPVEATGSVGTLTMDIPGGGTDLALPDQSTGVFEGTGADTAVAVQATDVGVRALVHIDSAAAPERYEFPVGGDVTALRQTADGGAEALNAEGLVIAAAPTPWAKDANGAAVPTHFEVEGTTLVQVVEHRGGSYAYGVVADPDFIFVAKCSAAIALFGAENGAIMTKVWRVFKGRKALLSLFRDIKWMSRGGKVAYIKSKLGHVAADLTGIGDLVSRCTP